MSLVWQVFEPDDKDKSKAICSLCKSILSRGGENPRNQGTSNLKRHLQAAHPKRWREVELAETKKNADKRKSIIGHC